jgi:hypothetical protein
MKARDVSFRNVELVASERSGSIALHIGVTWNTSALRVPGEDQEGFDVLHEVPDHRRCAAESN